MSSLIPFSFESREIRFIPEGESFSVVAKDVLQSLDYTPATMSNMGDAIKHVPDEWKGRVSIPTLGGIQEMLTLTEQGVYFFVNRSDKPKALPLQKWVSGEVLPSIRKTGSYSLPGATPPNAILAAQLAELLKDKVLVDYETLRVLTGGLWAAQHVFESLETLTARLERQIGKPLLNRVGDAPVSAPLPAVRSLPPELDQPRIAAYLAGKTRVSIDQIIIEVLGENPNRSRQVQIGHVLRRLGWTSRQATTGDRARYYQRPA